MVVALIVAVLLLTAAGVVAYRKLASRIDGFVLAAHKQAKAHNRDATRMKRQSDAMLEQALALNAHVAEFAADRRVQRLLNERVLPAIPDVEP